MTLPGPLALLSRLLLIAGLGACYLQGLRLALRELSLLLTAYQPWPVYLNIAVSVSAALAASGTIFAFNRFVTRQNTLHLGTCCALFAFVYFILVRGWLDLASYAISVLNTPARLLAMVAFIGTPLVFGLVLRKRGSRIIGPPPIE